MTFRHVFQIFVFVFLVVSLVATQTNALNACSNVFSALQNTQHAPPRATCLTDIEEDFDTDTEDNYVPSTHTSLLPQPAIDSPMFYFLITQLDPRTLSVLERPPSV